MDLPAHPAEVRDVAVGVDDVPGHVVDADGTGVVAGEEAALARTQHLSRQTDTLSCKISPPPPSLSPPLYPVPDDGSNAVDVLLGEEDELLPPGDGAHPGVPLVPVPDGQPGEEEAA